MIKTLFAINEATPIYKLGGLGDVGGSLPVALASLGVDLRLVLPLHPEINLTRLSGTVLETFPVTYNQHRYRITVYLAYLPSTRLPVYLFGEPELISLPSGAADLYADKYALFSLAVATWVANTGQTWIPDLLHLHDWHTALIPVLLTHRFPGHQLPTLITIHNLAYQGITVQPVASRLALPPNLCQILRWDAADGDVNILLEGLLHADLITTVSPTYAREILTERFGARLHPVLQAKQSKITGILNGLDQNFFNPVTDAFLSRPYSIKTATEGKWHHKSALQTKFFGGQVSPAVPLIAFIGRLDVRQKGIDLILDLLRTHFFTNQSWQFIFLGTGDPAIEAQIHGFDGQPGLALITRFDEPLAHQLYAGADLLFIPSHYEPCGLIQLIAMRYGTLPVAHAVGGLKDTIRDHQTGFLYHPNTVDAATSGLIEAVSVINHPPVRSRLIKQAMTYDSSWSGPARLYVKLYRQLVHGVSD